MRTWLLLLGGLIVWAAHFFALYAAGEIGGQNMATRTAALLLTVACLAADAAIARAAAARTARDPFSRWVRFTALAGAALSAVAVIWQGMAALAGDV